MPLCATPARVEDACAEYARNDAWWDRLVNRMTTELQKQLAQIESLKAEKPQSASDRAANARTLDSLQRTMERLMRAEQARAAVRERKVQSSDGEARNTLVRRLDKLFASGAAPEISGGDK
jgi:Skp family chaperone for outer membrane proteins